MQAVDISFWSPLKAFIRVSGPDATSFLHRMSTANIKDASKDKYTANLFVNQKGRLIDAVYQKRLNNQDWLLISAHEDSNILINWLEQFLFSEDLVLQKDEPSPPSFLNGGRGDLADRISQILPKAPNEICDKYNPFELNLGSLVAFNKGCYLGQEVLSRLDTYQKVSKKLVAVSCENKHFETLKQAPEITSYLNSFTKNQPIALGVFKKTALTSNGFATTSNGIQVGVVSSAR